MFSVNGTNWKQKQQQLFTMFYKPLYQGLPTYGPKSSPPCFVWLMSYGFYMFKWLKKTKRIIVYYTGKLYEIQILVSINKVLMEHGHACGLNIFYGCSLATRADLIGYKSNHWQVWQNLRNFQQFCPSMKSLISKRILLLLTENIHSELRK